MGFAANDKLWTMMKDSALPVFAVALLLVFGLWLIVWIRDRYRGREDHAASPERMLMQFRELQREGDLSEEEFRSIKGRLAERLGGRAPGKPPEDAAGRSGPQPS